MSLVASSGQLAEAAGSLSGHSATGDTQCEEDLSDLHCREIELVVLSHLAT